MGIGHVAVALGLKRVDSALNLGLLFFAVFLADFLLGWFAWAGWETYTVPAGYASKHYLLFTFPWSHGLLPDILWASLLGGLTGSALHSRKAGLVAAAAVLSHYLLDGIVHVQGLPVAGPGTYAFGLGLWRNLPLALSLEVAMTAVGLALYVSASAAQSRGRRIGVLVYTMLLGCLTVWGQASATEVPPRAGLIANWIAAPLVFAAIAWWLDRSPKTRPQSAAGRAV